MSPKQIICVDASSLKGSACGRKLFLTTALGYTSAKLSNNLLYGTCFHRAAELSAHGASDQAAMEAALKKWDEDIGDCEIKSTSKYLTREHLGSMLFRFFLEQKTNEIFYKCPYIKVGSSTLAECKFSIPIYSDSEVDVLLQGTMDGIFQLMQGCAAIGDWKTTCARFPQEYFFGYKMSVQLRTYMWAVNWYIKHYPDSVFALAFKDALKIGAFIYGVFLTPQGATFQRSQLFTFSKRDMEEYERMLMNVVNNLVSDAKIFNETGLYPMPEGIINGACQEVYGSNCKYCNACASQVGLSDSEDPMPLFEGLLNNHFIRKAYRPLEFGGGEKKEKQTNEK